MDPSKIKTTEQAQPPELREKEDFYLEDGVVVFTEQYLLRKGSCCFCGCRHCPYRKQKKNPDQRSNSSL